VRAIKNKIQAHMISHCIIYHYLIERLTNPEGACLCPPPTPAPSSTTSNTEPKDFLFLEDITSLSKGVTPLFDDDDDATSSATSIELNMNL
jgi:hypothetical protein